MLYLPLYFLEYLCQYMVFKQERQISCNIIVICEYNTSLSGPVNISALPAAPLKDVSKLRASILCNQAYVWLGLGDPLQALKPAQELFSLTSAPVNLR